MKAQIGESIADLSETAKRILKEGSVKARVRRAGMLQLMIFTVKRVKIANQHFVELFINRMIDVSELSRLADEFGLPVEAEIGRAFPDGKGAKDFLDL